MHSQKLENSANSTTWTFAVQEQPACDEHSSWASRPCGTLGMVEILLVLKLLYVSVWDWFHFELLGQNSVRVQLREGVRDGGHGTDQRVRIHSGGCTIRDRR